MPEGPSIVLVKENLLPFKGRTIERANGYADIDLSALKGKKITGIRTWGKHLLIVMGKLTLRIHFMLFGSYAVNEPTGKKPKLHLVFDEGELFFYVSSISLLEEPLSEIYDWTVDIMDKSWDPAAAKLKIKEQPNAAICDCLMDQHIFSGVGNIIKNESLFMARIHPLSKAGKLPARQLSALVKAAHSFTQNFLKWKKANELSRHLLAYGEKVCPRCDIPFHKEYLGKTRRRTFFCRNCQLKY